MPSPPAHALAAALLAAALGPASAQQALEGAADPDEIDRAETPIDERRTERGGVMHATGPHVGEMLVEMDMPVEAEADPAEASAVTERLRFEPWQMLDEMFLRDDVVFLMRHGPTDEATEDAVEAAPGDCEDQRVLSEEGRDLMMQMGQLMAANEVVPARVAAGEWCRGRQTVEALMDGIRAVDPSLGERIATETDPALDPLPPEGAEAMLAEVSDRVRGWDGSQDAPGPLLLVSDFVNLEELTTFTAYEGEILIVDPDRDGRVLGYLRLGSASPDPQHFDVMPIAQAQD